MEGTNMYSKEDIYKAYDMGLLFAIKFFESVIGFTTESQLELVEKLKEYVSLMPSTQNPIPKSIAK